MCAHRLRHLTALLLRHSAQNPLHFVVRQILPQLLIPDSEDISTALHTCGDEGRAARKSTLLQELQEQSTGQTQVRGRVSSEELNICPRLILAMLISIR